MSRIYIETPRLILRDWRESDYESYISLNADAEVMEYFTSVRTPEQTLAQIGRFTSHLEKYGFGFWAMERKDNWQFIGFTGLTHAPFDEWFTPCIEIGWRISKANWGMGFATEAAKACLDYGFDILKFNDIYSFTSVHNKRSEQVMIKTGMQKAGEFDHPDIEKGHPLERHVLYKISRQK